MAPNTSHQLSRAARMDVRCSHLVKCNARVAHALIRSAAQHCIFVRPAVGLASRTKVQAAADAVASPTVPKLPPSNGPVMVWFQHDLRISDHPGLLAAIQSGAQHVVPFFCLDPALYAHLALMPAGPTALLAALSWLRAQLRAAGSDLVFRLGPAHVTTAAAAGVAGVQRIILERQEESRWLEAGHLLAHQLDEAKLPTRISTWQAPLWQQSGFKPNFKDWKAARGAPTVPLAAPDIVPPLPAGIEPGTLPELPVLEQLLAGALAAGPAAAAAAAVSSSGRVSPNGGRTAAQAAAAAARLWGSTNAAGRAEVIAAMLAEPMSLPHAVAAKQLAELLLQQQSAAAGAAAALPGARNLGPEDLLDAYLAADTTVSPDPQLSFLRAAVAELESPAAPGASFPALLGPLMGLGVLSGREVYARTVRMEAARWGGRMPVFGPASTTAKAVLAAAELTDFHRQLAGHIPQEGDAATARGDTSAAAPDLSLRLPPGPSSTGSWYDEPVASASSSYDEGPDGVEQWGWSDWPAGVSRRCSWRWRGALTDFCVIEPRNPKPGAPPLLLVHGFGAFGDQWRFNLGPLSEAGYRVFAPTLPGFGRSEKAALQYSQNAWRDFIRDFLVCVVGAPAVLVGNSIGGFISASAAADYPALAAGLVLVNSAGPITPGYTSADAAAAAAEQKKPPPPWMVRLITMGLMAYLQNSIAKQLKWLYPTNPDNADEWLEREIYRAACDSRSADVFASVFYLPKPRALNYLITELWRGPTGVVQGVLDPLNDAKSRADQLKSICAPVGLRAWELQAGHCPHDEVPVEFNRALIEFVEELVIPHMQQLGSSSGGSTVEAGSLASTSAARS